MQKLLVIGAGIGQVPLVSSAIRKGIYTVVVTSPGRWPATALADEVWQIDVFDCQRIVDKAKSAGITAVISDQNDLMMPTVARVAEELGLPGVTPECVHTYCNKNAFRTMCDKIGVPCPKHIAVQGGIEIDEMPFPPPWIVKPADSQSSMGVSKAETAEELAKALEVAISISRTHTAIVEEFFKGQELVCEGFVKEGFYYHLAIGDRRYFDLPNLMIPSQTLFPSLVSEVVRDRVIACERSIAKSNKPAFGIVHSEYLYDETGDIRIVESAIRGGGVYISSHLIPLATGINVNELLLEKALGYSADIPCAFENRIDAAAGYICFHLPEGLIVKAPDVEQVESIPCVAKACLDGARVGSKTKQMTHKGQRYGPILVSGRSRADLEVNIEAVKNKIGIEVVSANGEIQREIWE